MSGAPMLFVCGPEPRCGTGPERIGGVFVFSLTQRQFNILALAGLATAFLLLAAAFAGAVTLTNLSQSSNERVQHTYRAISQIALLEAYTERAETAARGYLLAPDPKRVVIYRSNRQQIEPTLSAVAELTADNPRQRRAIAALRPTLLVEIATVDRIMQQAMTGDMTGAREEFRVIARQFNLTTLRDQTDAMVDEERRLIQLRETGARQDVRFLTIGLAITGLLLALMGIVAGLLVRRFVNDLNRSNSRLSLLNSDLEGEVGRRTADLQRANGEIQRFAYIVSHDLRSPLVNVLGFTAELDGSNTHIARFIETLDKSHPELVGEDVRQAALEDLPEAIAFIRSSTQKMDRLINAILNLSRQGARQLTQEHLPMDAIIGDVIDSLTTLAEERGATIAIEGQLPDITNDRLAIEQIFQNIIENATKYLRPGAPGSVFIRGRGEGDRAIYEVEDNGRGVDLQDHERIFELFRRSGAQDQRGEGLGLAHVRALAWA